MDKMKQPDPDKKVEGKPENMSRRLFGIGAAATAITTVLGKSSDALAQRERIHPIDALKALEEDIERYAGLFSTLSIAGKINAPADVRAEIARHDANQQVIVDGVTAHFRVFTASVKRMEEMGNERLSGPDRLRIEEDLNVMRLKAQDFIDTEKKVNERLAEFRVPRTPELARILQERDAFLHRVAYAITTLLPDNETINNVFFMPYKKR